MDSDKLVNAKDDVKIPKASILDVQARFGFRLYGYFMGKRVASPVLHTVRVEYEWEPPRCGVCMIFGHDVMLCPKCLVEKPKKQHTNHDGFQHSSSSRGTNVGSRFQVKPKKPIWQVVSKKNIVSSRGMKKNFKVSRKVMSSTNHFDALNMIEEGDEIGTNEGSSNLGKKVVQDVVGSAYDSSSNTPLVSRINDLESQIIEGKDVLLDDAGKLLKPSKSTLSSSSNVVSKKVDDMVNKDNDSKVKEEIHGEDPYDDDDFDDPSLTDAQMKFANAFDINFHDQLR
ncbi:hypothetical protein Tco_0850275 [Tanacetum coccineum]